MNEDTKRALILAITLANMELLNHRTDLGVCYDTIDGVVEVFWYNDELILLRDPGELHEARNRLSFRPDTALKTMLEVIRALS